MLPLQPNDELVFTTPPTSGDHNSSMEGNIISFSSSSEDWKPEGETVSFGAGKGGKKRRDEYDIGRVIMRRDVERRRRLEMSNLCVSLRSCLPVDEQHKGRSSLCDEIQRGADYIKKKRDTIEELRIRRDELKKLSKSSTTETESTNPSDDSVTVNHVLDGVEILVTSSIKSSEFGLSRILGELLEQELDVVSCISTQSNGGLFHKILIEGKSRMRYLSRDLGTSSRVTHWMTDMWLVFKGYIPIWRYN